ncbi:MAG: hypothetical protein AAGD00_08650 [Planctomycetota bacterium]
MTRTRTVCFAALGAAFAPLGVALAQDDAGPPPVVAAWEFAGIDALLPTDKDARLVEALKALPTWVKGLREFDNDFEEIPEEAIDLVFDMLGSPARFAIAGGRVNPDTGAPELGINLAWTMPDREALGAFEERFEFIAAMTPLGEMQDPIESKRFEGMQEINLPFGALAFGPRESRGELRYELIFGKVTDPDAMYRTLPEAPAGVDVVMRATLDFEAATPLMQMAMFPLAMAGEAGEMVINQVRGAGLMGDNAIEAHYVVGHRDGRFVERAVLAGARDFAEPLQISKEPLPADLYQVIPSDAIMVFAQNKDHSSDFEQLRAFMSMSPEGDGLDRFLAEFEEHLGVSLEDELIPSIGQTGAVYLADSTGGNALTSLVLLQKMDDADPLKEVLSNGASKLNAMLREELEFEPVMIQLSTFERGGVQFSQFQFSGLPIPVQPTLAVVGDWVVAAGSPNAAMAAVAQAQSKRGGMQPKPWWGDATMIAYADTEALLRDGYPTMTLLSDALVNTVRPRNDRGGPQMIVPLVNDLAKDAKLMLGHGAWDGDDFVWTAQTDSSLLVSLSAVLGMGDAGTLIGGAIVGGTIGANAARQSQWEEWEEDWDEDDWDDEHKDDHEH